jgi:hypothetical protein
MSRSGLIHLGGDHDKSIDFLPGWPSKVSQTRSLECRKSSADAPGAPAIQRDWQPFSSGGTSRGVVK